MIPRFCLVALGNVIQFLSVFPLGTTVMNSRRLLIWTTAYRTAHTSQSIHGLQISSRTFCRAYSTAGSWFYSREKRLSRPINSPQGTFQLKTIQNIRSSKAKWNKFQKLWQVLYWICFELQNDKKNSERWHNNMSWASTSNDWQIQKFIWTI